MHLQFIFLLHIDIRLYQKVIIIFFILILRLLSYNYQMIQSAIIGEQREEEDLSLFEGTPTKKIKVEAFSNLLGEQNSITHQHTPESVQTIDIGVQKQNISIDQKYKEKLQDQKLAFITDLPNSLVEKYKFGMNAAKEARIRQQINNFGKMLPCEHTNSVFVRCDQQRCDVMNILISGSTQTPYSSGLYLFELTCPDQYPNVPPKMEIITGRNQFRFNPNLYQNGYLCLSILGNWQGSQDEMWQPSRSSLLQVFLSIQSLVMTNDVYFNEPGYENSKGTPNGELQNTGYCNLVKLANIRFAMIEMIRNPPLGFQAVVHNHFKIKRNEILQECEQWVSEADKQATYFDVQNQLFMDTIRSNPQGYKELLVKTVDELKKQLEKIEAI